MFLKKVICKRDSVGAQLQRAATLIYIFQVCVNMHIVPIVVQRHLTEVRSLCFNLISTLRNEDAIMVYTIGKKEKSLKYFMKLKLIFQNTQEKITEVF